MSTIFEFIFDEAIGWIWYAVVEVVGIWTGEVIRFALTLGRHKPRWKLVTREDSSSFVLLQEVSFWIGIAFWLVVSLIGYGVYKLLAH